MHPHTPYLGRLSSVHSIVTYHQASRDCNINVMESQSSSVIIPIFQFYLTALMNYVSVNSIFSTSPSLIAHKCAIINLVVFENGNLNVTTLNALLKYQECGFYIQSTVQSCLMDIRFAEFAHECGLAIGCSEMHRSTYDRGSFRACIHIFKKGSAEGAVVENQEVVMWHLGG